MSLSSFVSKYADLSKLIGNKRRWRAYKARTAALPRQYRDAIDAVERYLMYLGGVDDGNTATSMLEDLADLFERAATDQTPLRDIVGNDPVEFVETFARSYGQASWIAREQQRLVQAIDMATAR